MNYTPLLVSLRSDHLKALVQVLIKRAIEQKTERTPTIGGWLVWGGGGVGGCWPLGALGGGLRGAGGGRGPRGGRGARRGLSASFT